MDNLEERLRRVKLIVCDVDGVLTDGSIPYDGEGKPFRTVHVRDVTAFTLWHLSGGKTALLSGLGSAAVEAIARQPEAGAEIRGAALLIAILLEGATIIALVFALLFKLA